MTSQKNGIQKQNIFKIMKNVTKKKKTFHQKHKEKQHQTRILKSDKLKNLNMVEFINDL